MTHIKKKNGFTLIELIAVVVILITVMLIALITVNKQMEKARINAFIEEVNVFAKAGQQKYSNERSSGEYDPSEDIFYGAIPGKACYSIKGQLIGAYVEKSNSKYVGSVEVCYALDCEYQTKIWMTDGEFYVDGETNPDSATKLKTNFTTDYPYSCGVETAGGGGTSGSLTTAEFDFTGKERVFTVAKSGVYSLEAWGAQGGSAYSENGGLGAYAYTEVELQQGDILYVRVGGKGTVAENLVTSTGGWNGGGDSYSRSYYGGGIHFYGAGGGFTSIATKSGQLGSSVPIDYVYVIAGGGSGAKANLESNSFGSFNAGGITDQSGAVGQTKASRTVYGGATSTEVGHGGGYFSGTEGLSTDGTGSGGSSFIANPKTRNGVMYGVNVAESNVASTKTISTTNFSDKPVATYGKRENGYAKITYIGSFSS